MAEDLRTDARNPSDFLAPWLNFGLPAQASAPIVKAAMRFNMELMSLTGRRMRAYLDLPSTLGRCRSPQDLAAEQMRFWQTAARDYTDSSRNAMEAWGSLLSSGVHLGNGAAPMDRDFMDFNEARDDEAPARKQASSRRAA
jgi:hypothetical protein